MPDFHQSIIQSGLRLPDFKLFQGAQAIACLIKASRLRASSEAPMTNDGDNQLQYVSINRLNFRLAFQGLHKLSECDHQMQTTR